VSKKTPLFSPPLFFIFQNQKFVTIFLPHPLWSRQNLIIITGCPNALLQQFHQGVAAENLNILSLK